MSAYRLMTIPGVQNPHCEPLYANFDVRVSELQGMGRSSEAMQPLTASLLSFLARGVGDQRYPDLRW